MEESIVKVKHLSHRYSVQWAIKDINFEIKNKGTPRFAGIKRCRQIHHDEYHVRCSQSNRRGGIYKWYQPQGTSGRSQKAHRFSPTKTSSIPGTSRWTNTSHTAP